MKKAFRMGEILTFDALKKRMPDIVEWKNLTVDGGYHAGPVNPDEMISWLETYGLHFTYFICDTTKYLNIAASSGKSILFEAQLGACLLYTSMAEEFFCVQTI